MNVHTDNPIPAIIAVALLASWYADLGDRIRQHWRYTKQIRTWRQRIAATADQLFSVQLLTKTERNRLIGRNGLTSDEWARRCAADIAAGRRDRLPTCADYLREFGKRPKVRPAENRTLVRN